MEEEKNEQINEFNGTDTLFAWVAVAAGYAFWRVFPASRNSFAAVLFMVSLFAITTVVLHKEGCKFDFNSGVAAVCAFIALVSMVLYSNEFMHFTAYIFMVCCYIYFVYAMTGNCIGKAFSEMFIADNVKAIFVLPFRKLTKVFPAIGRKHGESGLHTALKIGLGLLIAFVPTAVVFMLLNSDDRFSTLINSIFNINGVQLMDHLVSLIFGVPVAMYIFAVFYASRINEGKDIDEEKVSLALIKAKVIPEITAVVSVLPLLALYVIYFASQWVFYVSAFTGKLPEGLTYADYARNGFFQLCAVAFINLTVIICLTVFMRQREKSGAILYKCLATIFCVFTLILIATAVSKLALYIGAYGLTELRLYAMWFMSLMTVIFVTVLINQFASKTKAASICVTACIGMYLLLALCGVDETVSRYNVRRYENYTLYDVDATELCYSGSGAIPQMIKYAEIEAQRRGGKTLDDFKCLSDYLEYCDPEIDFDYIAQEYGHIDFWGFTVSGYRAYKLLK